MTLSKDPKAKNTAKTALITGITGQDGSYLAELLLEKGYRVCGMVHRSSTENFHRIEHLRERIELLQGDLLDPTSLASILAQVRPDEVYNLAPMSFVPTSCQQSLLTVEFTAVGVTLMLEAIRQVCPNARYCQASSSEMFGNVREAPQKETTPFQPCSPYGMAEVHGHHTTVNHRKSYNLFACSSILFDHESPRQGLDYTTRKISHGVAQIKMGLVSELRLGNLEAKHDWGFAGDYVRAMWLMLQQDQAADYVIGTGEAHSVGEFVQIAFDRAGLDWRQHVVIDPQFYQSVEMDMNLLLADATKARQQLNWKPEVGFEQLVTMMVDADLATPGAATRALRRDVA